MTCTFSGVLYLEKACETGVAEIKKLSKAVSSKEEKAQVATVSAQNTEIDKFEIDGNLGSDGDGEFDTLIYEKYFNSSTYSVFVKRVWDAAMGGLSQDPSVNHIIIVNSGTSSITQSVDETNEDDTHVLTGLSTAGVTEIYYLLLALRDGDFLENNKVEDIVDEFINILDVSSDINELLTNLNQDYTNIK
jgi:chaperonin GroEL (HSP60 family)